jgi:hypothetical protein
VVVESREDAVRRAAQGEAVVLLVDVDSSVFSESCPGRVAVLVGSPSDPEVWASAEAMSVELFGS